MSISDAEYSLMSANVYGTSNKVRSALNTLPVPGWTEISQKYEESNGFMAKAYIRGAELVISYAGTTDENVLDWVSGNVPAATAVTLAPQIFEAAKFYLEVLQNSGAAGATSISFTGHSLGGGLASLMAVYFNRPAVVFDEAPFIKSADSSLIVSVLKDTLVSYGFALPTEFQTYETAMDPTGAFLASPSRELRDDFVRNISIKGEVLSLLNVIDTNSLASLITFVFGQPVAGVLAFGIDKIRATDQVLDLHATSMLGWDWLNQSHIPDPVALHSISLLSSMLQYPSLVQTSQANPELLPRLFAGNYPNASKEAGKANLIDLLSQQQALGAHSLDALVADVSKISHSGLTGVLSSDGSRALAACLIDVALGGIYQQAAGRLPDAPSPAVLVQTLQEETGAISVERSALGSQASLLMPELVAAAATALDAAGINYHPSAAYERYTFQNGLLPVNVAFVDDLNDVVIGFTGDDVMAGGAGDDFLAGGEGNDVIDGGGGEDFLLGGAGEDWLGFTDAIATAFSVTEQTSIANVYDGGTGNDFMSGSQLGDFYRFHVGDGRDTVWTRGGADVLFFLSDGGPTQVVSFNRDGLDLMIWLGRSGNTGDFVRVVNWFTAGTVENQLGSVDYDGTLFTRQMLTVLALRVEGSDDVAVGDRLLGVAGYSDVINGNGGADNINVAQAGTVLAADTVHGGEGNDTIFAGNSSDTLYGDGGRDYIDGGAGADVIYGGADVDNLRTSGTGATLYGDAGNDTLYDRGVSNTLNGGDGNDYFQLTGLNATANGGAGNDNISPSGVGTHINGGTGDDSITGSVAAASIYWQRGDGADSVWKAASTTVVEFGADASPYTVTAYRDAYSGLILSASSGGSVTLNNWFNGQNQANVHAPDGSEWTSAQIASQFHDPVYSVNYSTGVLDASVAAPLLLNYLPDLSTVFGAENPYTNGYAQVPLAWVEDHIATLGSQGMYTDASNQPVYRGGISGTYEMLSDYVTLENGWGGNNVLCATYSLEWDYWFDAAGNAKLAVTAVSWSLNAGQHWTQPEDGEYVEHLSFGSSFSADSANSTREMTLLEPGVFQVQLTAANQYSGPTSFGRGSPGDEQIQFTNLTESASAPVGVAPPVAAALWDADTLDDWLAGAAMQGFELDLGDAASLAEIVLIGTSPYQGHGQAMMV